MDYSAPPPTSFLCPWDYWRGLPFSSPRDLPNPGIEPRSPACGQILYHLSHHSYQQPWLFSTSSSLHTSWFYSQQLGWIPGWPHCSPWPTRYLPPHAPSSPKSQQDPPTTSPASKTTESQNLSRTACSHDSSPHIQGISSYCHFHGSILIKLYVRHGLGTKEHILASFLQRSFCQASTTH